MPGTLIVGIIFLVLLAIALFIFLFIFWLKMLIDCIKRNFKNDNEKIVWVLVIVLLGLFVLNQSFSTTAKSRIGKFLTKYEATHDQYSASL